MNTDCPRAERPHPRSGHPVWPLGLCALAVALAAPAARAGDGDPADQRYCSLTATLLYRACGSEAEDDRLVSRAKCINLADSSERAQCLSEARKAYAEAGDECTEQFEARQGVCAALGEARYDPPFEPERFDSDFTRLSNPNPYFPLGIGNRWEYRGGDERTVVEIANEFKRIEGVTCIVLRDLVYRSGRLLEATDDWFAAGRDGSTWYCGEESKDYETFAGDRPRRPELVSIDGSFKHGRDNDKAGIIMPARPMPGQRYYEEFSLGNAEDVAEIVSATYNYGADPALDALVPAPLAQRLCNSDCVVTRNTTALEPGGYALKYYARGIGFFLETVPAEGDVLQLVACNFDARCAGLPAP